MHGDLLSAIQRWPPALILLVGDTGQPYEPPATKIGAGRMYRRPENLPHNHPIYLEALAGGTEQCQK